MKKKKEFIDLFEQNMANISSTCSAIKISRQTYYNWKNDDGDFKDKTKDIQESMIDRVESALYRQIFDLNNLTAIIFYLKTMGRKRGWNENREEEWENPITGVEFIEIK